MNNRTDFFIVKSDFIILYFVSSRITICCFNAHFRVARTGQEPQRLLLQLQNTIEVDLKRKVVKLNQHVLLSTAVALLKVQAPIFTQIPSLRCMCWQRLLTA